MEGFILGLTVKKEVSKVVSCSVSLILTLNWGTDTLFEKLTPEIGGCTLCLVSLFNVFSDCLYFDALITRLSQICLIISQTLAEGSI